MAIIVMTDYNQIYNNFRDLFVTSFKQNCHLDDASITQQELQTLQDLDAQQIFENFNDLVKDLLHFKSNQKSSDKAELAQRSQQLQSQLQKVQGQVRNHIRAQHQLKLHIDNTQTRAEELQSAYDKAKKTIKALQAQLTGKSQNKQQNNTDQIKLELIQQYEAKLSEITGIAQKRETMVQKVQKQNLRLKNLLKGKSQQVETLKKQISSSKRVRTNSNLEFIKRKLDTKSSELNKIQEQSKVPVKVVREGLGQFRKAMETEINRSSPSPFKVETKKHRSRNHSYKVNSRQHMRTQSENTRPRPQSSKRPLHW